MQQPTYAGFAWYAEADYPRVLAVMTDAHVLPPTFASWLQQAEQNVRRFEAQGCIAIKAHLKPDDFVDWCRSLGIQPDSQGRVRFANEAAARVAFKQQNQ